MGTPNWCRCFAYSTPSSSAAPARPTSAPAIRTRHSSTVRSWSSTARAPRATTVRVPVRRERSAIEPSPRLCNAPNVGGSVSITTSSSSSSPTTTVATAPAGTRRASPSRAGCNATVATGGRSSARRSKIVRTDAPPDRQTRRPATNPSTSGIGARAAPKRSATSSRSSSVAPPPPSVASAPMVGPPSAPNASHSSRSNPPVSSDARTTEGGHSLAKNARNDSTRCSCSSLSERSTATRAARGEGRRHALPAADHRPVGVLLDVVQRRSRSRACAGAPPRSSRRTPPGPGVIPGNGECRLRTRRGGSDCGR